ncbi:MAG: GNAT family N-acetyltransferase [Betaproteobacteria bacterium]|nr:GNAT family N-acetyltransferase [Betaproteobacteria bacterium]
MNHRAATVTDIPAIVALTNRAFLAEAFCVSGDRTDDADIRQRFSDGTFYVADHIAPGEGLAASVFCSVENGRGYMGLLSVDPQLQGRGLSRFLLNAVEHHCREAGCHFLDITVVNARDDLFPIYNKLGFTPMDVLPFPVPERALRPLTLVKMTKPLRPPQTATLPG